MESNLESILKFKQSNKYIAAIATGLDIIVMIKSRFVLQEVA